MSSPIAPFFMDKLYQDLNAISKKDKAESIHLTDWFAADKGEIDKELEERMQMAQKYSSMVLGLRKQSKNRVRQPLQKILIPISDDRMKSQIDKITDLILSEVNVKELEYLTDDADILVKKIKPNFKTLGPKYGKMMKQIAAAINKFGVDEIKELESNSTYTLNIDGEDIVVGMDDVEILTQDIPGWAVSNMGNLTVALDITITEELRKEGLAREFINRIQNLRKDKQYEVTDKIEIEVLNNSAISDVINDNYDYICSETLTEKLTWTSSQIDTMDELELDKDLTVLITICKVG
jgi:isoleucyl-tRNA synthetase